MVVQTSPRSLIIMEEEDPQPPVRRQPPSAFREGKELEWPLLDFEPFVLMARDALENG